MSFERLGAIVLAAGTSTRMGERNKLLIAIEGIPLLRRVTESFVGCGFGKVVIVTGFERELVEASLEGLDVDFSFNPNFDKGMGGSIAAGVRVLECSDLDGIAICVGDLASLSSESITILGQEFLKGKMTTAVAPRYKGVRGHPVFFPVSCVEILKMLQDDEGARSLFESGLWELKLVEMDDASSIEDIDLAGDIEIS